MARPVAKKTAPSKGSAKTSSKSAKPVAVAKAAPVKRSPSGDKVGSGPRPAVLGRRGGRFLPPPAGPAPLSLNGKPAKNQAGFKVHELELFRTQLLEKRRELVGDMGQMESEALQPGGNSNLSNLPIHMADMGTDNYEQEFTLGLMEKDRTLLQEINHALARILDGTFGICEGTGKPIGRPRIEAQPWARFSIEYARKVERRLGG